MPRYEYRCRACGDTFEVQRSMSESGDPATCPGGHDDTVRLLSTFATAGAASRSAAPSPKPSGGGGCCGGGCCG